jgi:formylglycine-generating enzyme required for sulfatase activity
MRRRNLTDNREHHQQGWWVEVGGNTENRGRKRLLLCSLIIVLCSLSGCELFNNKPEKDVLAEIDDAINYANAAPLNVRISPAPGTVTTVTQQVFGKVGYAFTVQVTANPAYAFVEWRASVPGAATINHVTNEGRNTGDATVIVHTAEAITLTPFCAERPRVIATNMPRMDDRQVTNFPIKIKFNKALDETTVGMDDIVITGTRQNASAGTEVTTLTDHFERLPLDENGTLLKFEAKTSAVLGGALANHNITVVVGPDISEAEYGVSMASREVFSYGVNDGPENNPPVIIGTLYGSFSETSDPASLFSDANSQTLRQTLDSGQTCTVYLVFDAFEDMGDVRDIRILEEFIQDNLGLNGVSITDEDTHPGLRNIQAVRNSTSPLRMAYQGLDNNLGVDPFIIPYTLKYPAMANYGITALHVQPADAVGNRGDYILRVYTAPVDLTIPDPVINLRSWYDPAGTGTIHLAWKNPVESIDSIIVEHSPALGTVNNSYVTTANADTGCTITGIGPNSAAVYEISVTVRGNNGVNSDPAIVKLSPYVDEMSSSLSGTVGASHTFAAPGSKPITVASFKIGKTEVTYALWWTVYQWATSADRGDKKYTFANAGRAGATSTSNSVGSSYGDGAEPTLSASGGTNAGKNQPVAFVSWRDAVVFCNAYSEMTGLKPVYRTNGSIETSAVLRVSEDSTTYPGSANTANRADIGSGAAEAAVNSGYLYIDDTHPGYRLPLEKEWEFAARGGNPSAAAWSYTYSGSNTAGDVAWYSGNAGSTVGAASPNYGTHAVATKNANAAGLYDMSGNMYEWCQEIFSGNNRVARGGSWNTTAVGATASHRSDVYPSLRNYAYGGFRLAGSP